MRRRKEAMTRAKVNGHRLAWEKGPTWAVGRCIRLGCRAEVRCSPETATGDAITDQCKGVR